MDGITGYDGAAKMLTNKHDNWKYYVMSECESKGFRTIEGKNLTVKQQNQVVSGTLTSLVTDLLDVYPKETDIVFGKKWLIGSILRWMCNIRCSVSVSGKDWVVSQEHPSTGELISGNSETLVCAATKYFDALLDSIRKDEEECQKFINSVIGGLKPVVAGFIEKQEEWHIKGRGTIDDVKTDTEKTLVINIGVDKKKENS